MLTNRILSSLAHKVIVDNHCWLAIKRMDGEKNPDLESLSNFYALNYSTSRDPQPDKWADMCSEDCSGCYNSVLSTVSLF